MLIFNYHPKVVMAIMRMSSFVLEVNGEIRSQALRF